MQRILLSQSKRKLTQTCMLGRQQLLSPAMMLRTTASISSSFQAFSSISAKRFPNEPDRPIMKTAFPGPATLASIEGYGDTSCNKQQHFPVDMHHSTGNYVSDVDGNHMLDVFTSIACIGMGYNHPSLLEASKSDLMRHMLATRTGVGINPPMEYQELYHQAFMNVAPRGMTRVMGAMCGTCSVEAAFKHALISYAQKRRGGMGVMPSQEELETTMDNLPPGSPNLAILSFNSGFHGRLLGALSATRTSPLHKLDVPAFDWPAAEPPRYKYPLAENAEYNREQDRASLAQVRILIEKWCTEKGSQVCAIIIEPIQSEGGDNEISSEFAQSLQDLTKELGIYFIVDEVQTGVCATGTFWAHEQWNLRDAPDFVTFAKKMLSCGFYHNENSRMVTMGRHMNTFMGDPVRAILTAKQNKVIIEDKLADNCRDTGTYLQKKLVALASKHPNFVANVRGQGTFLAFDCETTELRDNLIHALRQHGVNSGGCGAKSMRLRPTLYFEKKHADIYIDALDKACDDVKHSVLNYIFYDKDCSFINQKRDDLFRYSIENKEAFWGEEAEKIHWFKKPQTVVDESDQFLHRWFPDGETNLAYNCLDRHVKEGHGDRVCFYEDSVYTGKQRAWTYNEVLEESGKLATVMKEKFGIQAGDRVVIFMPMIIESAFTMLACARLGAVHSVVFGGFASKELANRIDNCEPKLVVTSSMGIEPNKHIPYTPIVEEALNVHCKISRASRIPRLIKQRDELDGKLRADGLDTSVYSDYDQLMSVTTKIADCAVLPANHPAYILYTSGTTGQPKGVVRDIGGTQVALRWAMENIYNLKRENCTFANADIGWQVGHSNVVYGPQLQGCASVLFEGKPITPNPGVIWQKVEQYGVNMLFMAPTGIRVIKKEDYDSEWVKKYDVSSINGFLTAGERCDPDTIHWLKRTLPEAMINDTWWQTETGWPIVGNLLNTENNGPVFPTMPGSVTKPIPGYDLHIFNEQNEKCKNGELGKVVIKLPMPPSFMLSLWGNDQVFIEKYLTETPGYYTTGDAGFMDSQGYVHIMTRVDDVINTAGHRLSTGRLEEVVNEHPLIVESAVVAYNDEVRGECPLAFVILKGSAAKDMSEAKLDDLRNEINQKMREDVGAFAKLYGVIFMDRLPKTRSGKILRGTIKSITNEQPYKTPSTIEDLDALGEIADSITNFRKTLA